MTLGNEDKHLENRRVHPVLEHDTWNSGWKSVYMPPKTRFLVSSSLDHTECSDFDLSKRPQHKIASSIFSNGTVIPSYISTVLVQRH